MATKTDQLRAVFRQAFLYEREHGRGMTKDEAEQSYQLWGKKADIYNREKFPYGKLLVMTRDMVLDCGADWKDIEQGSYDRKVSYEVLADVKSRVAEEAYERAMNGEYSTVTAQYLTDAERENVLIQEEIRREDQLGSGS